MTRDRLGLGIDAEAGVLRRLPTSHRGSCRLVKTSPILASDIM